MCLSENKINLKGDAFILAYRSPIGILKITRLKNGTYGLFHKDVVVATDYDINSLADQVFTQTTGYDVWDMANFTALQMAEIPSSIGEWDDF